MALARAGASLSGDRRDGGRESCTWLIVQRLSRCANESKKYSNMRVELVTWRSFGVFFCKRALQKMSLTAIAAQVTLDELASNLT